MPLRFFNIWFYHNNCLLFKIYHSLE
jgi:hypothetical protein